jgi:hypothetical protein
MIITLAIQATAQSPTVVHQDFAIIEMLLPYSRE